MIKCNRLRGDKMYNTQQIQADRKRAVRRDFANECLEKFESGEVNPEKVVKRYESRNWLYRAVTTLLGDEVRLEYDTARSFLEQKVSEE